MYVPFAQRGGVFAVDKLKVLVGARIDVIVHIDMHLVPRRGACMRLYLRVKSVNTPRFKRDVLSLDYI